MSEYTATIVIKRSARGEGDEPLIIVAASGESRSYPPESAIEQAYAQAHRIVRMALDELAGIGTKHTRPQEPEAT